MKSKMIDLNIYEDILRYELGNYIWFDEIDNVLNICSQKYTEIERLSSKSKKENKKKKTKESFDFESKICEYTNNEELRHALRDFADMRNQIGKSFMTKAALTRLLNKLDKIAATDEIKIEVLEKSILNNWQDIWEIRSSINKPSNSINKQACNILSDEELEKVVLGKNDLDEF